MSRPEPIYQIHQWSQIVRLDDGAIFDIKRRTANSVFITTPGGEVQLDRIALERRGGVKRKGVEYHLKHPELPRIEKSLDVKGFFVIDGKRVDY